MLQCGCGRPLTLPAEMPPGTETTQSCRRAAATPCLQAQWMRSEPLNHTRAAQQQPVQELLLGYKKAWVCRSADA